MIWIITIAVIGVLLLFVWLNKSETPKQVIALLGDSHVARGNWDRIPGVTALNFGKENYKVEQIYFETLPKVIESKPSVCFIHGGINDIIKGVPSDTTEHYYRKIIDSLKAHGIQPVIIELMPTRDPSLNEKSELLNKKLRTLAPTVVTGVTTDNLSSDGIHMEGPGYIKWAAAIQHYLHRK